MVDNKYKDFKSQYEMKDEDASKFKDHDSQFNDLHLRMQALVLKFHQPQITQ